MAFPYIFLILAGLMGIHSQVTTVSKVSVKAGGSISIPCLYDPKYIDRVKYLCEGQPWYSCTYAIKSNQPSSEKFSISDNTNQTVFTVTINYLKNNDTYWCAVKKFGLDVKQRFQLSVETGTSSLYVDQQKINAFERGSVTVVCHYKHQRVTKWCRLGSTCVTGQTGSIDGTPVTINASVTSFSTVTMSELTTESSGWYWCANKDFQIPVHITVHKLPSTTTTTMGPTTTNFTETLPTTTQHASLLTSAEPTNSTINGADGEGLQDEHKISIKLMIGIITIISLLLLVPAAFFGWRIIKRSKTKPDEPNRTVVSHTGSDPEVFYATITHNQHVAAQQKIEPAEGSVIYSTLKT